MAKRKKNSSPPAEPFVPLTGDESPQFIAEWAKKYGVIDQMPPVIQRLVGENPSGVVTADDFQPPEGSVLKGHKNQAEAVAALNKFAEAKFNKDAVEVVAAAAREAAASRPAPSSPAPSRPVDEKPAAPAVKAEEIPGDRLPPSKPKDVPAEARPDIRSAMDRINDGRDPELFRQDDPESVANRPKEAFLQKLRSRRNRKKGPDATPPSFQKIIAAILASREASLASRIDKKGLNRNPQPLDSIISRKKKLPGGESLLGRDLVLKDRESEQLIRGRGPRYVKVRGREIELPKDFRERKRFRTLLNKEIRRERENKKTENQMKGRIGRGAYALGRGTRNLIQKDRVFRPAIQGIKTRPINVRGKVVRVPTNPLLRLGMRARPGLMGAGFVGGAAAAALIDKLVTERGVEQRRQELNERQYRQQMLDMASREDLKKNIRENIDHNLNRLRMIAPDIYARTAAGRILPQGAIVIGGVPRQDLLNELGMAMANGQFSQ